MGVAASAKGERRRFVGDGVGPDAPVLANLLAFVRGAALVATVAGLAVALAWVAGLEAASRLTPRSPPMTAATGLAFAASGLGILLLRDVTPGMRGDRMARSVGVFVAGGGVAAMAALVFVGRPLAGEILRPWLIYPLPAAGVVVLGIGIALRAAARPRARAFAPVLAVAAVGLGLLALVAAIYDLTAPPEIAAAATEVTMAPHTAVLFVLAGAALLASQPLDAPVRVFASSGAGGIAARRLGLVLLVVPLALGAFVLEGVEAGSYSAQAGFAILATALAGVLSVLGWYTSATLERHASERARLEAEQRAKAAIVESSPDAILSKSLKGMILSCNQSAVRLFGGASRDDLVGRQALDLIPRGLEAEEATLLDRVARGENIDRFPTLRMRLDGTVFNAEVSASPIRDAAGDVVSASLVVRRVPSAEGAEIRFRGLLEAAPDAMVIVDTRGRIVHANTQTEVMFGYHRADLLSRNVEDLIPGRFREKHITHREGYFEDPHIRPMGAGLELFGLRASGEEFPVEVSLSPLRTEQGVLVTAAIRDVTERKRAEQRFKSLLEAAPDAIVIVDASGRIVLTNRQTELLFDQRREDLVGQPVEILIPDRFHEVHAAHRRGYIEDPRTRPMGVGLDLFGRRRDGTEFPVEISLSPLETEGGVLVSAAVRDITERKRSEERLVASLHEKEALLREIHHRVKNNLQVTSGLLMLQSRHAQDEATRDLFVESMNRVKSMALVHEKLYESTSLASIDLGEYMADLLKDLLMSYGGTDRRVTLTTDLLDVRLDTDSCINLGLILNELVSNAFKHAFAPGRPGALHVGLVPEGPHELTLVVKDDGVGLPEGFDETRAGSMGLQLVSGLARQLNGRLVLESQRGTEVRVTFPRRRVEAGEAA